MAAKHNTYTHVPEAWSPGIIDRLGGWSIESVGEAYGEGYPLSVLSQRSNKLMGPTPQPARDYDEQRYGCGNLLLLTP